MNASDRAARWAVAVAMSCAVLTGCCRARASKTNTEVVERETMVRVDGGDARSLTLAFEALVAKERTTTAETREREELSSLVKEVRSLVDGKVLVRDLQVVYPKLQVTVGQTPGSCSPQITPKGLASVIRFREDPAAPLPAYLRLNTATGDVYGGEATPAGAVSGSFVVAITAADSPVSYARLDVVVVPAPPLPPGP